MQVQLHVFQLGLEVAADSMLPLWWCEVWGYLVKGENRRDLAEG